MERTVFFIYRSNRPVFTNGANLSQQLDFSGGPIPFTPDLFDLPVIDVTGKHSDGYPTPAVIANAPELPARDGRELFPSIKEFDTFDYISMRAGGQWTLHLPDAQAEQIKAFHLDNPYYDGFVLLRRATACEAYALAKIEILPTRAATQLAKITVCNSATCNFRPAPKAKAPPANAL